MCNISEKIIRDHLVQGELKVGEEIAIKVDQTLTQDATGTLAYMFLESMGVERVKTELSVSYIDHNTLQVDNRNADDHLYLQTVASKYGIILSKAGNGICHSLHLENFAKPTQTLIGSDSHTPTAGALGMLAIGAGGLDVAAVMGGEPYYMVMPEILGIKLKECRRPWVSAKDVILHILGLIGVKGAVGKILEYFGDGLKDLGVSERATIANMGAETGATTSIFPSDHETLEYMSRYGREEDWVPLLPPRNPKYDKVIEVDLSDIEPLAAAPHSPANIVRVSKLEDVKIHQVCIGGCTNSSFEDIATVASILKGRKVHPEVSLVISPGSRRVLKALIKTGYIENLISAGARILECACGPCIGMGQAPPSGGVSVRTYNRNFEGRCGTRDAEVYLVSPEVAAASAIYGYITDPRVLGEPPKIEVPSRFDSDDSLFIRPPKDSSSVSIFRGPHMKPPPPFKSIPSSLEGEVLLKVGDDITTDHILPAGAKVLSLRSNIPEISNHAFRFVDPHFVDRAKSRHGGFIVAGENYGQGSSREHAALCLRYLGVKAVIAKSFARIHKSNLINFGVLPLAFSRNEDYEAVKLGDQLVMPEVREKILKGESKLGVKDCTEGFIFEVELHVSERAREILLAGGLINLIKQKSLRSV